MLCVRSSVMCACFCCCVLFLLRFNVCVLLLYLYCGCDICYLLIMCDSAASLCIVHDESVLSGVCAVVLLG